MPLVDDLRLGVLLDLDTLHPGDLDLSRLKDSLPDWQIFHHTPATAVAERIRRANVVVSNKVPLDATPLRQANDLQLICIAATGVNNVDLDVATACRIAVCNVRRYATPSVVEHVFSLILALTRRLEEHRNAVGAGRWQAAGGFCLLDFPVRELAGETIGIVGFGELGKAVARIAEAFGMRVLIAQRAGAPPQPWRYPLAELLPQVDILSLHCPLTEQTHNLIDASHLALLKPDALLINTARGGIVNERALAHALQEGRLGGAGIDVLEEEPPAHGSPLLELTLPNLIITPHVAWASREARQRLIDQVEENIRAFGRGTPRNLVNQPAVRQDE
jgi:glycerate dehydrogenase